MQVVVDNTAGGDAQLAEEVAQTLRDHGMEVELRTPVSANRFDTGVHLVSPGIAIRVPERPEASTLRTITEVVRTALQRRTSLRRRTRTVPVHLGETGRVLTWIDVFEP
jgi:hypothetical protein